MKKLTPPSAPKRRSRPKTKLHSVDEWRWLEDIKDPATLPYLKAENTYFKKVMKSQQKLREQIYTELKGRIAEDDSSVPEKDDDYWYYSRYKKGSQYPLYCRKFQNLEAPEKVYLDHNKLAADLDFCDLGFVDISRDHRYVAYGLDTEGEERYTIRIKDTKTGRTLSDSIEGASSCFEWKSSTEFFYVKLDEHDRPLEVYYHVIGTDQDEDILVYKESDLTFFVGLDASESDEFIFIMSHGYDANEVRYHRVKEPGYNFSVVEPRSSGHEYEVSHRDQDFFILTNWKAENFRLVSAPVTKPGHESWQDIQAHQPDILLEGLLVFKDFYVLAERSQGLPRLKLRVHGNPDPVIIKMDDEAYDIGASSGRDFHSKNFRYWASTPRLPSTLYEFDILTQQKTVLKKRRIPDPKFDENNYIVRRLWAKSRDGKDIPLTAIHHQNFGLDQPRPVLIQAYGSYGETMDADFSSYRLCLADRGFVYILAHVRGGMDMGRLWYLDGKLDKKWNTFNDYIDACDSLIQQGITKSGWIIGEGGSAGGMLMGVVANERPELFLGLVASVPFVDVLNTMLDDQLPLTTLEYHEWGNPNDPAVHALIKSYSPYENVRKQKYPHMLVIAGLNDKRVMYWEAAKWVAKLRKMRTDKNLLLFRTELSTGHGGASGRYDALKELAEELSFIIMLLNHLPKQPA
jgi:oligopeptidase B